MYDLTLNIDSDNDGLTYEEPGIHDNFRLGKLDGSFPIVYEVSKNGSEFIAFHFLSENNKPFVHTEWLPKSDDPAVLAKKERNLAKRIRHICKRFIDESLIKKQVANFKELAELVIASVGNTYKGKLLRAKIVYNDKNYTTFPNYVPFLESMDIPKDKSKLKMGTNDKVVKTRPDALLITRPNPFVATSPSDVDETDVSSRSENDLPF